MLPNDIALEVVDFMLQDVGNAVYTEYDLNEEVAGYIADNLDELLGTKVALLHSHNKMAAFFSGTDIATLNEKAKECNNVLSVVVNNAGTYVAKFTQQILATANSHTKVNTKTTFDYTLLGDSDRHETTNKTEESDSSEDYIELKMYDCDLIIPKNMPIDEEFQEECIKKDKELALKKKAKAIADNQYAKQYSDDLWSIGNLWHNTEVTSYCISAEIMATSILLLSLSNESAAYDKANLSTFLKASTDCIIMFLAPFFAYYNPDVEQCDQIIKCINSVLKNIDSKDACNFQLSDKEEVIIEAFNDYIFYKE